MVEEVDDARDACVVHKHIDPAKFLLDLGKHLRHGAGLSNIHTHAGCREAARPLHIRTLSSSWPIPVGHNDVGTFLGKSTRNAGPDAPASPRDNRDLPDETLHVEPHDVEFPAT
jgi:hypothetical protein